MKRQSLEQTVLIYFFIVFIINFITNLKAEDLVFPDYFVPEDIPKTKTHKTKSLLNKKNKVQKTKTKKIKKTKLFLKHNFAIFMSVSSPYGLGFRYKVLKNKSIDFAFGLDNSAQNPYASLLYTFHNFKLLQFINFYNNHFDLFYGGGFRIVQKKEKDIAFCFSVGLSFFVWQDKLEVFGRLSPVVFLMLPEPDLKLEWSAGLSYNF